MRSQMTNNKEFFTERVSLGSALVFNIPATPLFVLYVIASLKGAEGAFGMAVFLGAIWAVGNVLMFGQKITATPKEISHRNSFFKTTTIHFKDGKPLLDIHTPPPRHGSGPLPRIRIRGSGKEISLHGRAFSRDIFSKLKNHIEQFGSPKAGDR